MKRVLAALLLAAVVVAGPAYSFDYISPSSQEETITVSNSAIGITSSICVVAGRRIPAIIQVKSNSIYFSLHSASATPDSNDFIAVDKDILKLSATEVKKLRMIRVTSDATVKVQCYE